MSSYEHPTILVVGASGRLGGRIVRGLLASHAAVRMLVRPNSDWSSLAEEGAWPRFGDLTDRTSVEYACRGIDVIVSTATAASRPPPDTIDAVDRDGYGKLIAAALGAGVKRIVYVSAIGADPESSNPLLRAKGETERRLARCGIATAVIAPMPFMDVWIPMIVVDPIARGEAVSVVGTGDVQHALVAIDDVATATLQSTLLPDAPARRAVVGPRAVSWRDLVAESKRFAGRSIEIVTMTREAAARLGPMLGALLASFARPNAFALDAFKADDVFVGSILPETFIARVLSPGGP